MLADTSEFDRLLENLAAPQPQMQGRTFHISSATLLRPISPQFLRPDALLDAEVRLQNLGRKKSQLVSFQKEIASCTQKRWLSGRMLLSEKLKGLIQALKLSDMFVGTFTMRFFSLACLRAAQRVPPRPRC